MESPSKDDIRRLLKTFGIQADDAITAHVEGLGAGPPLQVRLLLEDLTDYGDDPPENPLRLEIEGQIRRL
jgi:hypothetical protein